MNTVQAILRPRVLSPLLSPLLAGALLLTGCGLRGSGTPATEVRELEAFDHIEVGGTFNLVVHVEPGAAQKLELTADDNILEIIETKVLAGELDIDFGRDGLVRPKTPITVEIWVPSLAAIDASGTTEITVDGLHGESFVLENSGTSDSTLSGAVEHFEVEISGVASLDAKQLDAKQVVVRVSGTGNAEVRASEQIDARISGTGEVRYWGEPGVVNQEISGTGSLVKRGK